MGSLNTNHVIILAVICGVVALTCYVLWKAGKFVEALLCKGWNKLFGPSKEQLAQQAAEEAAAEKQRQEDERSELEALNEKMERESKAREFRVASSLGFKNAQEARAADENGFDAMIDQEMEREQKRELGCVDIYRMHTMAPTRQMNDTNRSASLS
jgi:hypothetical protein